MKRGRNPDAGLCPADHLDLQRFLLVILRHGIGGVGRTVDGGVCPGTGTVSGRPLVFQARQAGAGGRPPDTLRGGRQDIFHNWCPAGPGAAGDGYPDQGGVGGHRQFVTGLRIPDRRLGERRVRVRGHLQGDFFTGICGHNGIGRLGTADRFHV